MHNLSVFVEENKKEAIEIVKAHNGRFDFIKDIIHNNPDDYEEDDFLGDIDNYDCPIVIMGGDNCLDECKVLSVVYDESKNNLMAWVMDTDTSGEIINGWYYCSFDSYSEDDVYQHIYNLEHKNGWTIPLPRMR